METSFNTYNAMYFRNVKPKNPTFGIKIPELETAIETFVSKADNTALDEQTLIRKIKKFLETIMQQTNFIGAGCENKIYDLGKYVFKIPQRLTDEVLKFSDRVIKNNNLLGIDSYYGESLLQVGNIKILNNIGEHIPCGVPYAKLSKMTKEEIYKYYFENYFQRIVQLPQSSFDKFAQDVRKIAYPKTIDFQNPNNTVIAKDNKIVLTDDLLNYNKYCGENSTAKLLRIFMLDAGLNVYTPEFGKYINDARALFKKIILSGVKAGLILSSSHEDNLLIKDALLKCKAKIQSDAFLAKMAEISRNSDSQTVKLERVGRYIDDIFR